MDSWVAGIAGALGGAIGGLIGFFLAQFSGYVRRPRLRVDFEDYASRKPYVHNLEVLENPVEATMRPGSKKYGLFLRLNVSNDGGSPAMHCEARVVVYQAKSGTWEREPWSGPLHWTIRDPLVYREPEKQYAPIHLNPKAPPEALDVLGLLYTSEASEDDREVEQTSVGSLTTISHRPHVLTPNQDYGLEITVSANNSAGEPFPFRLTWDGTLESFRDGRCIQPVPRGHFSQRGTVRS